MLSYCVVSKRLYYIYDIAVKHMIEYHVTTDVGHFIKERQSFSIKLCC